MRVPEVSVCVVGLGYVGLPTAALIANRGVDVLGVDINQRVVDTLNAGEIHIVEPDLGVLVRAAVNGGHLRAACVPEPAQTFRDRGSDAVAARQAPRAFSCNVGRRVHSPSASLGIPRHLGIDVTGGHDATDVRVVGAPPPRSALPPLCRR